MSNCRIVALHGGGVRGVYTAVLREGYFRLAPLLKAPVALDEADKIPELMAEAERVDQTDSVNRLKANLV